MQFSIVALLSIVALAYAAPAPLAAKGMFSSPISQMQFAPRNPIHSSLLYPTTSLTYHLEIVARQTPLPTESSVMSDANGNVVAFNSAGVHQRESLLSPFP